MIIYMTEEQAKKLGEYLISRHAWMEGELKREYPWKEMARDIGIGKELLVKLKEGKRKGMNDKTARALELAFGPDVLGIIGLLHKGAPMFTLENKLKG